MASGLYAKYLEKLLTNASDIPNLTSADIRAILVDVADYTVNLDTHDYLDDVAAGARVGVSGNLANKTVTITSGRAVFDADDVTISSVSGDGTEAVILYCHDGGADNARLLLAYFDNAGVVVTPNGNNIVIQWDSGASKIFRI